MVPLRLRDGLIRAEALLAEVGVVEAGLSGWGAEWKAVGARQAEGGSRAGLMIRVGAQGRCDSGLGEAVDHAVQGVARKPCRGREGCPGGLGLEARMSSRSEGSGGA